MRIGRHLQAFGDHSSHDGAMRENVINTLSSDFLSEHKEFMGHLYEAIKVSPRMAGAGDSMKEWERENILLIL